MNTESLALGVPHYIIGDEGVTELKLTARFLGPVAALGALLADTAVTKLPSAFRLADGSFAGLSVQGNSAYIAVKLPDVRLRTFFSTNADGKLFPSFRNVPDALSLDLTWVPPADMNLWFGIHASHNSGRWGFMNAYLFASQRPIINGFWRLPLPNVYPDSRVCMGDSMGRIGAPHLPVMVDQTLEVFRDAPWNSDLINNEPDQAERAGRLIQFDPATPTTEQVPAPTATDWTSFCARVSHLALERFALS